jgi:hypothetical protein
MWRSLTTLSALAAILGGLDADAATLTRRTAQGGADIVLRGDIAPEDADSLAAMLRAIAEDGQPFRALRLNSPGGSLVGGIALAKFIRSHGEILTEVESGATCASACFLAFAAGAPKVAAPNSLIGVHGVADLRGEVSDETRAATRVMGRVSNELGVPVEITDKMIATPPNGISWLTSDELRRMGATIADSGAATGSGADEPDGEDPTAQALRRESLSAEALEAAEGGDYAKAVRLWRLLGEEGQGVAQFNLGSMYYSGQGVGQDYREAARWWRSAAERGVAAAQFNLGVAYGLGRGVARDLKSAYMWLSVAAINYATAHEQELASRARDLVSQRMTKGEIAEAQRLTGGWARSR